jgi:hypothetical protein
MIKKIEQGPSPYRLDFDQPAGSTNPNAGLNDTSSDCVSDPAR